LAPGAALETTPLKAGVGFRKISWLDVRETLTPEAPYELKEAASPRDALG